MKNNQGFTLVELVIVIAIIGILVSIATVRYREISYIHDMQTDLDKIISFFQEKRMLAFTQKTPVRITVAGQHLTNDFDGNTVKMSNAFAARTAGGAELTTFTINTRGLLTTTGNIYVNTTPAPATQFSCVQISQTSIREGKINGSTCNAK